MKAYAAAWLAHERIDNGDIVLSLASGIVFAGNYNEAMGKLMTWAREDFPVSKGFFNHLVTANEIEPQALKKMAAAIDDSEITLSTARATYESL